MAYIRNILTINSIDIENFQSKIFSWWENPGNRRNFPWRETDNPYYITISEFMLQQTQASRVIPKYEQFIDLYPKMEEMASAPVSEIIKQWQGLGYNRRAVWLHESICQLAKLSQFPRDPEQLQDFKGIGPYTSHAILIFSFNADIAAVDTNIRRVLIHEGFINEKNTKHEIREVATQLVPKGRSRDWHNAIMDYGATEITARKSGISSRSSQSKFQGSNRQIRGQILNLISNQENEMISSSELVDTLDFSDERVRKLATKLVKDGLLIHKKNGYSLPK